MDLRYSPYFMNLNPIEFKCLQLPFDMTLMSKLFEYTFFNTFIKMFFDLKNNKYVKYVNQKIKKCCPSTDSPFCGISLGMMMLLLLP